MEVETTLGNLQEELKRAKENLQGVDENIKRFLGRDPNDGHPTVKPGVKRVAGNQLEEPSGRARVIYPPGRRREMGGHVDQDNGPPPMKRRPSEGGVFSRLSGVVRPRRDIDSGGEDEEMGHKPSIQSQVIATPKEVVSRKEVVAAQNADEKSKARNRRMFGALLGTLQKFRQEETRMKEKEEKRAKVELKLEEAARQEREKMRRDKVALFHERKRKMAEIKRIELKMSRMKEQEEWENKQKLLLNFIRTKSQPHIFYLPKMLSGKATELMEGSKEFVDKIIEKKREELQRELEAIDRRIRWRQGQGQGGEKPEEMGEEIEGRRSWRVVKQNQGEVLGRSNSAAEDIGNQPEDDSDFDAEAGPELDYAGPGKEEGDVEVGDIKQGGLDFVEEEKGDEAVSSLPIIINKENGAEKVVEEQNIEEEEGEPLMSQLSKSIDEKEFEPVYD